MSATARGAHREELDFYATPARCVEALLPHLKLDPAQTYVLEPGCGDGAIMSVLASRGFHVTGIEVDRARAGRAVDRNCGRVAVTNFLSSAAFGTYGAVIGNPPYSLALEFVEKALKCTAGPVAMLLRLNWLSSKKRRDFHSAHPAHVLVMDSRPSFCVSLTCRKKCGWQVSISPEADRIKACESCGSGVSVVTTDATEYAWFVWNDGKAGTWEIL